MSDTPLRYRAFLSYSHRDGAITQRLHRRLETYRIPRALERTDGSTLPARLHPVFRDRDELASAGALSASIQAALDESEALVVVCSPAAAASPWVDAEIAYFRGRHPTRPVLAFVVEGDPGLDPRAHAGRAALPLRLALADPAHDDGVLGEPLAADARPEADGFTSAFFKLTAGLLGVRYDDLRRRDQRRRQQRSLILVGAALIVAAVFAWLAWDATRARDAARAAQSVAELELRSERQTREFLLSVFQLADANEARGERVTVREVLDRAVERVDRTRFERPVIRSRFLATMGQAYSSLGLNRRGAELLRQSIDDLGEAPAPEERSQRLDSRIELADTQYNLGEYDAALATLAQAEADLASAQPLQRARVAGVRGDILAYLERDDEARGVYEAAIQSISGLPESTPEVALVKARLMSGRALLALFADDARAAREGFGAALALLTRVVGEDHPHAITAAISLGSAAYREGKRAEARAAWNSALVQAERVYDPDGAEIGTLKNNFGLLLLEEGELEAAEPLLRAALASDRRHRSESFDDLAYPLHNLGYLLLLRGAYDEADTLLREALPIAEKNRHRMLGPLLNALGDLQCARGEALDGRVHAQRALDVLAEAEAGDAWRAAQARLTLEYCRTLAGDPPDRGARSVAMKTLRARWPQGGAFVQRAVEQGKAVAAR
jgi:predicted negative regulator of RcsB-dependent stress response